MKRHWTSDDLIEHFTCCQPSAPCSTRSVRPTRG
jgi:hypothetical protein